MNKSDVEKALGVLAEICVVSEKLEGVVVEPRTRWSDDEFKQLYDIIVQRLGGRYLAGQTRFLITSPQEMFKMVPLSMLVPMPFAARLEFSGEAVAELAETMKTHGVLEPLVVRPFEGKYQVICGMRRWKAAEKAGLETVPCIVRQMTDQEALECLFIENEQREDLNDYEKGRWLKEMMLRFPDAYPTQEVLAKRIGRSRQYVSFLILHYEEIEKQKPFMSSDFATRVARLPEGVTRELRGAPSEVKPKVFEAAVEREWSAREAAGHMEVLREAPPEIREEIVEKVVREDLNPEEARKLVWGASLPSVTMEEALGKLQETTRKKVEKAKAKEEGFYLKL
ncbi:MAG: ParB/RepB/Spo0J family partition protein, partial [Candidatus Bathyarchaeales archaeon]